MGAAALFTALTAILDSQTKLVTAITAQQPPAVAAQLWTRFADDTKWIHDALAKLNGWMEHIIGAAPDDTPAPPKATT